MQNRFTHTKEMSISEKIAADIAFMQFKSMPLYKVSAADLKLAKRYFEEHKESIAKNLRGYYANFPYMWEFSQAEQALGSELNIRMVMIFKYLYTQVIGYDCSTLNQLYYEKFHAEPPYRGVEFEHIMRIAIYILKAKEYSYRHPKFKGHTAKRGKKFIPITYQKIAA